MGISMPVLAHTHARPLWCIDGGGSVSLTEFFSWETDMRKKPQISRAARWTRFMRRVVLPIAATVGAIAQLVRLVLDLR